MHPSDTGFFIGEHGGGDGVIANNKFAVYADGHVEIGGNVTAGNDSGIYTFNDTVDASSSEDIFSIYNLTTERRHLELPLYVVHQATL